jgi:NAD(P)-dependent dehydrogenase (short-subunit alcohol dehydrogenase family)
MQDAIITGRTAAVTGAGSGLGRDIALGLAAKGYRVFGTAITSEEITDLQQASGGAVTLTSCDITDEPAVKRWARAVSAQTDGGLNLLISNAGILTPGPIEALPLDSIKREFEVNVFGALSVMNAFLPALRKARGRIVQVSTWTAHLPLPFNGPSSGSHRIRPRAIKRSGTAQRRARCSTARSRPTTCRSTARCTARPWLARSRCERAARAHPRRALRARYG